MLDALGKPGVAVALTAMFFLLMQSRQMKRIGTGAKLVTPKRAEAPPHAAPPASPLTPVTAVSPVATVPPVPVACFPPMLLAGAAAHQGHVRQRMEDRVRLVHTADLVAAVVCDGVGGMPLGADAAEAATQAACEYLQKHARADIRCVEAVFTAAASGVQMAAAAKGVSDGDGLRTTLLVAIASGTSVAWAT